MIAYDDTYSVMEDGSVINTLRGTVLRPQRRGKYLTITLHGPDHPMHYAGLHHRLVAKLFLGAPPTAFHEVDHIDRNPHNNHVSNLRWATRSENGLNRNPDMKPRAHNTSGYLHIVEVPRHKGLGYKVHINRAGLYHVSTHDSLEEAILKRDEILAAR